MHRTSITLGLTVDQQIGGRPRHEWGKRREVAGWGGSGDQGEKK